MKAPKLTGEIWFNTRKDLSGELKGKVVLYDFWTYSCVNCQRTLPYLRQWWEKYKNMDFLIIGIHTPEFEFEKDPKNVKQAMKDFGVEWPVVMDNEYANWKKFDNHYWPAKYLANKDGSIVYSHFGEGNYAQTEKEIQKALAKPSLAARIRQSWTKPMPRISDDDHAHGNVCFIATPELYCGYGRGRLANYEGYAMDRVGNYERPKNMPPDTVGLSGRFLSEPEYVETEDTHASLLLNFRATEVNLVMSAPSGESAVEIRLNGKPIAEHFRGRDVGADGTVIINKSNLYNLVKSDKLVEGVLEIIPKQGAFRAYAFTFSGCK